MRGAIWPRAAAVAVALVACWLSAPATSSARIVTYGGGPARRDLYMMMHSLTPSVVRSRKFGVLFNQVLPDHAQVYGQPLLAAGRLIVVTEKNDVYELDPRTGRILLSRFLVEPWTPAFAVIGGVEYCPDLSPTIGVTSTPVVDTSADHGQGVIYLTARTPVTNPYTLEYNQAEYLMYALNLKNLSNVQSFAGGQPLVLSGSVPRTEPSVQFDATFQLQRPALLEIGGKIFAAFGSDCGQSPYRGWVMDVRASDGAVLGSWATPVAAGARGAGIWMAGAGLMSDGPGRIFFATGNGFDAPGYHHTQHTPQVTTPGQDPPSGLGESVVRLSVSSNGSLTARDFFTPCNGQTLSADDLDMSSGGVMDLPSSFGNRKTPSLLMAGGKAGKLFLLNRNSLGGYEQGPKSRGCPSGGNLVPAEFGPRGGIWSASAVWPYDGGWLFVPTQSITSAPSGSRGPLDVYTGRLGSIRYAGSTTALLGKGSSAVIVTSVGSRGSTAMVWVISKRGGSGTLRAYQAVMPPTAKAPIQIASFSVGPFEKFVPPGVGPDDLFVAGVGHIEAFGIR